MKKVLGAIVVGSVALMWLASGLAMAQSSQSSFARQDQQPAYTGTIAVKDRDGAGEVQEAYQYKTLAKTTMDEAVKAAQASLNTAETPSKASLENENGYVVWEVVIGSQAVKVDAGTGKVLHSEQASEEEKGGSQEERGEGTEQNEESED